MVVEPAVNLNLSDRAQANTDADERKAEQVPCKAGRWVLDAASVVESTLDEQASRADRFRVFSDERPLLREHQDWLQHNKRSHTQERMSHQNCRLLSTSTVTGPSLTSSTCIMAWNSPVDTGTFAARNSLTTAS